MDWEVRVDSRVWKCSSPTWRVMRSLGGRERGGGGSVNGLDDWGLRGGGWVWSDEE